MSQKDKKYQPKGKKFGGSKPGGGRGFTKKFEGDKKERGGFGGGSRGFGGKKPFKKREDGDDRGGRSYVGDKPFKKRFDDRDDRPKRDFDDRPRRRFDDDKEGGFRKERKPFGDKKFGDKKFGGKKFGDKKFGDKGGFDKKPRRFDRDRDDRRSDTRSEKHEASFETKQKLKSDRPSYGAPSSAYLYGVHAVNAALLNPRRNIQRLLVTEDGFESIREAYDDALANGLKLPEPNYVEKEDVERLLPRDAVHQGILLDCKPLEDVFLADILNAAKEDTKVLILDQVTDPHNIGAILRSASAFGAAAVIVQKLHAPDITGTVAKSACGGVEFVPIVREVNLSRAMEQLKEAGFFCYGLDERGKKTLAQEKPKGKVALVLGAEGDGLRRLVADNCDALVKLPTFGEISSLNVSNAAAVALYELVRAV